MTNICYRRVRIKQFRIIWTVLMFFFFMPANYVLGETLTRWLNYSFVGLCFFSIWSIFFFSRFGYKMKRTTLSIIMLYFWCVLGSSLVNIMMGNKIDVSSTIVGITTAIAYVIICDIGIWYSPKKTLEAILIVGIIMCSINAISILLLKNSGGMIKMVVNQYGRLMSRNYYFLGEDNASYFWSWPVLVIAWLYYYVYNRRKYMKVICWGYTVLLLTSYMYVWSVLSFLACIAVPIVLFLFSGDLKRFKKSTKLKYNKRGLSFNFMWITGLLFNFLLSIGLPLTYMAPVIQNVFHKSITLSGRVLIWEKSYLAIKNAFLTGYGFEPVAVSYLRISINHTHNLFLEVLYRGGIIGLIILCVTYISLAKDSKTTKGNIISEYLKIMIFFFIIFSSIYFAFYRYHYLILFLLLSRLNSIDIMQKYNAKGIGGYE